MSYYIINSKWLKQHSDSRGSQQFHKVKLQITPGAILHSNHREITAVYKKGGEISHFSSKYYTNLDESIFYLELGLNFQKLRSFIATYKRAVNGIGQTLKMRD